MQALAASIFIQSQCSKGYFNEMQAHAASLRVGFAFTEQVPLQNCDNLDTWSVNEMVLKIMSTEIIP